MLKFYKLLILFQIVSHMASAQTIGQVQQGRQTSIRGLSVVNDKVVWLSGSKGTVACSTDGGKNWTWQQIKGYEKSDFRDIEAFSDKEALIIGSGTPAVILKTTDGGANWVLKFEQRDTSYFLDAMDFVGAKHGFVLGDPINGKFLLLETNNGGNTWSAIKDSPIALKNEAAFAASGTCLRVNKKISIVTGGSNSRLITSPLAKFKWSYLSVPMTNGAASRGAFSIATAANRNVIVGGNYAKDANKDSVACLVSTLKRASIIDSNVGPAGYQSSVEHIVANTYLSTGTSGTNITKDGGKTWFKIDSASYNVCRKAKSGSLVILAGDKGRVAILKP